MSIKNFFIILATISIAGLAGITVYEHNESVGQTLKRQQSWHKPVDWTHTDELALQDCLRRYGYLSSTTSHKIPAAYSDELKYVEKVMSNSMEGQILGISYGGTQHIFKTKFLPAIDALGPQTLACFYINETHTFSSAGVSGKGIWIDAGKAASDY